MAQRDQGWTLAPSSLRLGCRHISHIWLCRQFHPVSEFSVCYKSFLAYWKTNWPSLGSWPAPKSISVASELYLSPGSSVFSQCLAQRFYWFSQWFGFQAYFWFPNLSAHAFGTMTQPGLWDHCPCTQLSCPFLNPFRRCQLQWWARAFDSGSAFVIWKRLHEVIFHRVGSLSDSSILVMSFSSRESVSVLLFWMVPGSSSSSTSSSCYFHFWRLICGRYLQLLHHSLDILASWLLGLSLWIFDVDFGVFGYFVTSWVCYPIAWIPHQFASDFATTPSFFRSRWLVKTLRTSTVLEFSWILRQSWGLSQLRVWSRPHAFGEACFSILGLYWPDPFILIARLRVGIYHLCKDHVLVYSLADSSSLRSISYWARKYTQFCLASSRFDRCCGRI